MRDILKANIKAGRRADETEALLNQRLAEARFSVMAAPDQPSDDPELIDVIIGCHSIGSPIALCFSVGRAQSC